MKCYEKSEEPILQSEKFNMSGGATVRIQIKESSYVITISLNTDMYRNLRMNAFKKGIRISSTLKKFPKHRISRTIRLTREFNSPSQLTEDEIKIEDKYYTMNIVIRFKDFIRKQVKKTCLNQLLC